MVSITMSVQEELKAEFKHFAWVNWSEEARIEIIKKELFEKYVKTGKLSKGELEFCEKISWHPVDELPLSEEFIKELEEAEKEPVGKPMTIEELDKLLGVR